MITSTWFCPACGNKEQHTDTEDRHSYHVFMECKCSKCGCEFIVDVETTEE